MIRQIKALNLYLHNRHSKQILTYGMQLGKQLLCRQMAQEFIAIPIE